MDIIPIAASSTVLMSARMYTDKCEQRLATIIQLISTMPVLDINDDLCIWEKRKPRWNTRCFANQARRVAAPAPNTGLSSGYGCHCRRRGRASGAACSRIE